MLLNNALVEKIREILLESLKHTESGSYQIKHDLGDELAILFVRNTSDRHWVINDLYFDSNVGGISELERNTHQAIATTLVKAAILKADESSNVDDMFNGITTNTSYESVIGLTVKFHCDVDSRRLMVAQTANPNNVLYALEEAVNPELSIDPQLMTSSRYLRERTLALFADYLLADLITHDVAI